MGDLTLRVKVQMSFKVETCFVCSTFSVFGLFFKSGLPEEMKVHLTDQ